MIKNIKIFFITLFFPFIFCLSYGGIDFQELFFDPLIYPRVDLKNPDIKRNIDFTLNIYINYCGNNKITNIVYYEDQLRAGKTRINLKNSGLTFREMDPVLYSLRVNNTVSWLVLDGNFLGDAGAEMLAGLLSLNTNLSRVELEYCSIGENGRKLLRKIAGSRKLDLVGLDKKAAWEDNINVYLSSCFSNSLPVYKSFLNYLRVDHDSIRIPYRFEGHFTLPYDLIFFDSKYLIGTDTNDLNYDLTVFGDIIKNSPAINSIYITEADFTNIDAGRFFASFACADNIKSIFINKCSFDDLNSASFFNGVNSSSISSLRIQNSKLDDYQMNLLSQMIENNKKITVFHFWNNRSFSREAFSNLIRVLYCSNETIQHLYLSGETVENDLYYELLKKKFNFSK